MLSFQNFKKKETFSQKPSLKVQLFLINSKTVVFQLKLFILRRSQKYDETSKMYLKLFEFKKILEISSYFCDLLRKYEL